MYIVADGAVSNLIVKLSEVGPASETVVLPPLSEMRIRSEANA